MIGMSVLVVTTLLAAGECVSNAILAVVVVLVVLVVYVLHVVLLVVLGFLHVFFFLSYSGNILF